MAHSQTTSFHTRLQHRAFDVAVGRHCAVLTQENKGVIEIDVGRENFVRFMNIDKVQDMVYM